MALTIDSKAEAMDLISTIRQEVESIKGAYLAVDAVTDRPSSKRGDSNTRVAQLHKLILIRRLSHTAMRLAS